MARNFKELYGKMPAESRARVETRVTEYKAEMALEEVRRTRKLTQVDIAKHLGIAQGAVSKIEQRGDMHVGTLRKHVEAMGGMLQLTAVFPDATIPLRLRGEPIAETRPAMAVRARTITIPAHRSRVRGAAKKKRA